MFRKGFHIIVALLLILTTAGFTISKHFCENRLISVSIYGDAVPCDHKIHDNCCHDSKNHFQIEDKFEIEQSSNLPGSITQESSSLPVTNLIATQENSFENFPFAVLKFPLLYRPDLAKLQRFLL